MRPLEFLEPKTLEEACSLLSKHKEEAKLISGGQSLVPILQQRLISPKYLINLKGLPGLDYIKEDANSLKIGALATESAIEISGIVQRRFPILVEAIHTIASVQVRNWGTIGGSLAHADPTGDFAPVLIALGAKVKATSTKGEREIALDNFFIDYLQSALEVDEILTEVAVPYLAPKSGGVYDKEIVRAGDTGISSMAVVVSLDGKQEVKEARIVLGCQASVPIRAVQTEKAAVGKKAGDSIKEVEEAIAREAHPAADVLGSVEYKVDLARVMIRHMLPLAIDRAKAA